MWTFGRKIALGFAFSFLLLLAIGLVAYRGFAVLTKTSYMVTHTRIVIEQMQELLVQFSDAETGQRGFLISGEENYLQPYQAAVAEIPVLLKSLRDLTADNANQQKRLATMEPLVVTRLEKLKEGVELRRQSGLDAAIKHLQIGVGRRAMDELRHLIEQAEDEERDLLKLRAEEVEAAVSSARSTIAFGTLLALLFVIASGILLTRSLTRQIATTVQHVRRSSTELQSAANQQAAGARETSTSMSEITTTISELLATSRQIAESTQRVASIAEQTAAAARAGDGKVQLATDSTTAIRQQVDLVVNHMLELGRKSQQIGAVLDIVSELAEQTNILAINATIEAAGAGDSGKRFNVVADEIRKLADRVAGSTKEIRVLIDDIRSAVNTTVMATEAGSKAVDFGARQFEQVAEAFQQIGSLVGTTTQAAREIELSTKQQTSAVEQVNTAIASTAQATKETEASSGQTLQTASQLAGLSKDLLRLVQARATA
jgi:methyl-accepting chemotaxis protein